MRNSTVLLDPEITLYSPNGICLFCLYSLEQDLGIHDFRSTWSHCYISTCIYGNNIKHNLQTSMNERTHFFIKIYLSHFILERIDVSVVCEIWVERHMLRGGASSSHIFFREQRGANACTPLQARQRCLWSAACPSLNCDSLHSVQIWRHGSHPLFSFQLHTCCTLLPWSCWPIY